MCLLHACITGLMFSIEATATYFAIRNYWRSFYAAAIGTVFFRFINKWIHKEGLSIIYSYRG